MSPLPNSGSGNQATLKALWKSAQPGPFERIFRRNYWKGACWKNTPDKWLEAVPSLHGFNITRKEDILTRRALSALANEREMPFSIMDEKCVPDPKMHQAFKEDIARALEELLAARGLFEYMGGANVRITAVLEKGGAKVIVADFIFERIGELRVKAPYGTLVLGLYSDLASKQDAEDATRGLWYYLEDNGYRSHFDERSCIQTEMTKHRKGRLFDTVLFETPRSSRYPSPLSDDERYRLQMSVVADEAREEAEKREPGSGDAAVKAVLNFFNSLMFPHKER